MSRQADALRRFLGADVPVPMAPVVGHVVGVGSGKGGTGTSILTALVAIAAAEAGHRTLLVDADAVIGTQHRLFGVESPAGLGLLAHGDRTIDDVRVPLGMGLDLVPGGGSDGGLTDLEHRTALRRAGEVFGEYALVLVDAGSHLAAVQRVAAAGISRLVVVATPDAIAAAAAYAVVKATAAKHPDLAADLLINRDDGPTALHAADEIGIASSTFLGRPLSCLATVPDDATLRTALSAGLPLPDAAAGSPVATALRAVALRLLREGTAAANAAVRSA